MRKSNLKIHMEIKEKEKMINLCGVRHGGGISISINSREFYKAVLNNESTLCKNCVKKLKD